MVEILALVLLHDEQAVPTAVELALEAGAPSKQTVLNILSRLLDGTPVPPLQAPQAFALQIEPRADVDRYDRLRDREDHHAA
ncbi:Transposase [Burkholderia sp. AU4i]|nr:Transposase [Burkholderia sp. AU4i]